MKVQRLIGGFAWFLLLLAVNLSCVASALAEGWCSDFQAKSNACQTEQQQLLSNHAVIVRGCYILQSHPWNNGTAGTWKVTYRNYPGGTGYGFQYDYYCGHPFAPQNLGAPTCPNCKMGEPINGGTGNVFYEEKDYGSRWLRFVRYYNSDPAVLDPMGTIPDTMGVQWRHTYARYVIYSSGSPTVAKLTHEDGKEIVFNLVSGQWTPAPDVQDRLTEQVDTGGNPTGWTHVRADTMSTEQYGADGKLLSITDASGFVTLLTYSTSSTPTSIAPAPGYLITVTDPENRTLQFVYNANGQIVTMTDPAGQSYGYGYSAPYGGNLTSVGYPDTTSKTYLYGESAHVSTTPLPSALTGVVDETGARYDTYDYDASGLAIGNYLGSGVAHYTLSYNNDGSIDVNDPLGGNGHYTFASPNNTILLNTASARQYGFSVDASHTFDSFGNVTSSTDFENVLTCRNYDTANGLETSRLEGVTTSSSCSPTPAGLRTIETDWNTGLRKPNERRTRDASGNLVARTDWVYNSRGQTTFVCQVDPGIAGAVSYVCGSQTNAPTGVRQTATKYCEQIDVNAGTCPVVGLVTSVDGPRTNVTDVTTYIYRASDEASCASAPVSCPYRKGDLYKITNALGQVTTFLTYDGSGRLLSSTDVNGIETDRSYSPRGWLTQRAVRATNGTSGPGDEVTGYSYYNDGQVQTITQPDGSSTTFTYDAAHRLTDVTDNLGDTIHYTLDAAGNRQREDTKDPSNNLKHSIVRTFNALGQLATTVNADGTTVNGSYTYDANGNPDVFTDGRGTVTDNDYDAFNRLSRIAQDPGTSPPHVNAVTSYQYNALDQLTQVTDPHGLNTTYTYDGLGNQTQLTSPDTGTATSTFDTTGNVKTRTDARGIKATYTYDALYRVKTITYPTTGLNVTYTWDTVMAACDQTTQVYAVGHVSQIQDGSGYTRFCYDRFGNVARRVNVINGTSFTTNYAYDLAHRLTQVVTPKNTTINYTRDALDRVTGVTSKVSGGTTKTVVSAVTYYPFGPVASITYGNGRVLTRTYDTDYVVSSIVDTTPGKTDGLNLVFGRDVIGNLTGLTSGSAGNTLAYDGLNRLTAVTDPNNGNAQIGAWTYDATGNRLTQQAGTSSPVSYYTYPSDSHHLIATGPVGNSVTRGYDAMGNTTSVGSGSTGKAFHYDDTGRMDQLQDGNGGVLMQYATNAMGQRMEKYLTGNSAATQYTIRDEAGQVLADYDGNSARIDELVWMDGMPVGVLSGSGATLNYLEPDQLGTPRVAIGSSSNAQTWSWSPVSDPFGQGQPSGSLSLNLRLPGQVYDAESGLNYNYLRDYDPNIGRYVESDALGLRGGIATYGYVLGNPLGAKDRFGASSLLEDLFPMPWSEDRCKALLAKINALQDELEKKWAELVADEYKLPNAVGGNLAADRMGHITVINKLDSILQKAETDYMQHCRRFCPTPSQEPAGKEADNDSPAPAPPPPDLSPSPAPVTTLGVGALMLIILGAVATGFTS